jgi:hypothetical protein
MVGLAARAGVHVEGGPQDHEAGLCSAESGAPRPGEPAFDRDDATLTVGRNGLAERCRSGVHRTVQPGLTRVAQEADSQGMRLPVETAVQLVWGGGAAPEVSAFRGEP